MNSVPLSEYVLEQSIDNKQGSGDIENAEGGVIASKNGTKYHYPWCSGAQTMKEENKIFFESIAAARAAGYLPAGNCSGLE